MFKNIIEQDAVIRLQEDIVSGKLAPSMLFFGAPNTGKSSAALELARILSCEGDTSWKCQCAACESHRYLQHTDLLILGSRPSSAQITAACSTFLRNPSSASARALFVRSLRKLQIKFSAVLMEDDSKLSKVSAVLQNMEEEISDFWQKTKETSPAGLEKICGSILKNAIKLEKDGLGTTIPVGRLRRAAYWCRLAPAGKRKTLIIENAEYMKEEGRNSLLKLLEEPPGTVSIILTAQRRETIIPTILSRLRQYRFLRRSTESENEVIRRVFQDSLAARSIDEKLITAGSSPVTLYLDSFAARNTENMYPLAAWFIASLARMTAISLKKKNGSIPQVINIMGERYAPIADEAGLERSVKSAVIVKKIAAESGNFEDSSFSRFLELCLDMVNSITREIGVPHSIVYNDIFKKYITEAQNATGILNQNPVLALETLLYKLKTSMARGCYG
jgi:DNA polymerase-3 subunit gamma/tau